MPKSTPDIVQQIAKLKEDNARLQQLHAEAEGSYRVVKQQLETVETELREAGIEPDQADVAVAEMEAALHNNIVELSTKIQEGLAAHEAYIASCKQALVDAR